MSVMPSGEYRPNQIKLIEALIEVGRLDKENQQLRRLIIDAANVLCLEPVHHPALAAIIAEANRWAID
jgi:hypothetical protein